VDGRVVERDVVGAINIGLKYLYSDGSPMALGSTGAHEAWVKLMIPHQGPTPLTVLPLAGKRWDVVAKLMEIHDRELSRNPELHEYT